MDRQLTIREAQFLMDFWAETFAAQGSKCAECGESVPLKDTMKRANTFDIICRDCKDLPDNH